MVHMSYDVVNFSIWSVWMCILVSECLRIELLDARDMSHYWMCHITGVAEWTARR